MRLDLTWLRNEVDKHHAALSRGRKRKERETLGIEQNFEVKLRKDYILYHQALARRKEKRKDLEIFLEIKACHEAGRSGIFLLPPDYLNVGQEYKHTFRIVRPWVRYPHAKKYHDMVTNSLDTYEVYRMKAYRGIDDRYWNKCKRCKEVTNLLLDVEHERYEEMCDDCIERTRRDIHESNKVYNAKDTDYVTSFKEDIEEFRTLIDTKDNSFINYNAKGYKKDDEELMNSTDKKLFEEIYGTLEERRRPIHKRLTRRVNSQTDSPQILRIKRIIHKEAVGEGLYGVAYNRGKGILSTKVLHSLWFLTWKRQGINRQLSEDGVVMTPSITK